MSKEYFLLLLLSYQEILNGIYFPIKVILLYSLKHKLEVKMRSCE